MKKILFVTRQLIVGGTEYALYETVKMLRSPDTEITVAVMKSGGELYKEFEKFCIIKDLSKEYENALISRDSLKSDLKKFKIISFAKNLFSKFLEKYVYSHFEFKNSISNKMPKLDEKYDVAVAYYAPYASMETFVINNVNAKRKLSWIHCDVSNYIKNTDVTDFSRCYEKFDKIICVSNACRDTFVKRHPSLVSKTETVYTPIDTVKIIELSQKNTDRTSSQGKITICSIGRLSHEKGFDLAVNAHRILKDRGHDINWLVCGDGDHRSAVEKLIHENNLEAQFTLLGSQKNPYQYINTADIYVQPSLTESYCLALAEARALKKPIVTTNFPCASEHVIHEHNGFICEMTPESIADAIEKLILSPELREKFSNNTTPVDSDHTKLKQLFE